MKRFTPLLASIVISLVLASYIVYITMPRVELTRVSVERGGLIELPPPRRISTMTVEEAILKRRSIREYRDEPILLEHLAMILWSAQGITYPLYKLRAAPSAGATYPLEIYVVIGERGVKIDSEKYLVPGVYKYIPEKHVLILVKEGDYRRELSEAALGQEWVLNAPVSIVICAVFERTTRIYGERGAVRYVPMEVGHVGQNIYLMATALGYGTVAVGAFLDNEVASVIGASHNEVPMYIMPIGVPQVQILVDFSDIEEYIARARSGSL